ncbi:GGDEF domain-containing protein [Noviherbaspirillum cavernae]|uniref:diguanylate cyclase n=1 Tax=Noviherbaspirillum cavernae TaxID=2320862 RepID=A0A418X4P4_9BURK|nr:GGDEF domain-containing protein [Noviherbaspirillum cavernae]RJG07351.1 GGDEF domain-containing protein [Noviherbaspirillum cavernae]
MAHTSTKDIVPHTDIFPLTEGPMDFVEPPPAASAVSATAAAHIPRQDHSLDKSRQAMRLKRLRLVCLFAGLYLSILIVFHSQRLIGREVLAGIVVVVVVAMAGLYGIFFSGLNQKAREKSLTAPIALFALAILLWTDYVAPQSRMVFVPFLFLVVAYGMYRLPQQSMLLLTAAALAGDAAVIALHYLQQMDAGAFRSALLHWLVLALTLPGFVMLAGRVRRLHSALHKAGVTIRNIEEHARRDQLLGCYNRRYLIAVLEEQKRLSDETGVPLCLAVIDLDHFKSINDEVGHLAGDEVLRTFARIAQENVRQGDVFGRYGGEEFVLILPETPLLAALNTAERIRDQVERHGWQGGLKRPVTVSIGLTQYIPGESVLDLFSRTDTAMYLAKRGGRNQVVVEEPSIELWQAAETELSV